jgi:N-methylhydantoinase A/oxoprolinase/acetone carboxylase beta subunit
MVVRGDGALVSAAFARQRPIETILSGPAASLVGARHLTGLADAVVSDIGGTTTDVAVLEGGRPRLDPEGATVGGWRTMVEAVAMRTFGLGGDSEVALVRGELEPTLQLGPRRLVPLALAAHLHGEAVIRVLERQKGASSPGRMDGRLAFRTGLADSFAAGLAPGEAKLYAAIGDAPEPVDRLVASTAQAGTLNRLVARGLVHLAGFTPSDAAHVLGLQSNWNSDAARLGAALFARRRDGRGEPLAATPEAISERVLEAVARRSAEVVFETAFAEDGLGAAELVAHPLVQRALDGRGDIARLAVSLDRPVVGLGASAALHYASLPQRTGSACIVPDAADVANAVGAVVGQVRVTAEAVVAQPKPGLFRVSAGELLRDFATEEEAMEVACEEALRQARAKAEAAGAMDLRTEVETEIATAEIRGERSFVEARVVAIAAGRPRIAADRHVG